MTPIARLIDHAAAWVMGHRFIAIGSLALLSVLSAVLIGVMGLRADFSPQALFTSFEDQQAIDAAFSEHFGKTENVVLYVVEADNVLSPPVLQYMLELNERASQDPWVRRMESIVTTPIPRGGPDALVVDSPIQGDTVEQSEADELAAALQLASFARGTLVSESGRLAVMGVFLNDGYENIAALRPVVAGLQAHLDAMPTPEGVSVHTAGIPDMRVWVVETMLGDQMRLVPISIMLSGLVLFLTFRWFAGMFLPLAAVSVSVLYVVGGMAFVREPFNILNQMLPTMLIIIGTSDAIHLLARYSEEYAHTPDRLIAARRTMVAMTVACFLTSFTTAIGFGSLVTSRTEILRNFGITAAIGVLIAYVVTVVLVPPILTLIRPPKHSGETRKEGLLEDISERSVRFVIARPKSVLLGSILFSAFAAWGATYMRIDTRLLETFPPGTEVNREVVQLQAELDGVLPYEVSLSSEIQGRFDDPEVLNAVWQMEEWMRQQPGVLSVRSYPDMLYDLWVAYSGDPTRRGQPFTSEAQVAQLASLMEDAAGSALDAWVTFDRRHLRVGAKIGDFGSQRGLAFSEELLAHVDTLMGEAEHLRVDLTGDAYSGARGLTALVADLWGSLGSAFVLIFLFMALLFRSLRMGLISIPPNVLPLLVTMAWMGFRDINLNTSTVITFSVAIGLAVDDSIHVLARFKEEYVKGYSLDESLTRSARGSGRAVIVTSVMLMAGLSVMLTSSFVPIKWFAELLGITITVCLVGDLIMLPALLKVFWPEQKPGVKAPASEGGERPHG